MNDELLASMPALRACSTVSVGYDNFDVDALNQRNVLLMHTPTVLTETVADTMMALVLSTARRVTELDKWVKAGEWKRVSMLSTSVSTYTTRRWAFSAWAALVWHWRSAPTLALVNILYNARRQHEEAETRFGARACDLETLLKESDFVCISLPLTEQTHHMIGAEQLKLMKPSAILINAGRGPVVDEQALTAALKDGTIHAAGLDVFEVEPVPADAEILTLPNVVALPHRLRHA